MATWNGSTDCALMLAAACPRVINDADVGGNTPLHHAVRTSKLPLVTAFLQQYGADPGRRNAEGATPLHFAAECKDPRCLEVLLKSCPPISARVTASGFTPLLSAVSRGRILCTLALLDAGASPMECSKQGHTALEVAAQSGRIELVKVLAPRVKATGLIGGAPAIQAAALAFRSALCCAALADAPDIMSWLIHEAGVPPDAIDPLGRYPLHCAAASGSLRGISILMEECFVSPDRVDAATLTPLLTAATAGYLDAVKLLIHHGASISGHFPVCFLFFPACVSVWFVLLAAKTSEGDTLCLCAVRSGNVALVRYLVGELNLGRRDKDNSGADLMMTAADSGNLPMIQMLSKEFGFSVNTVSGVGDVESPHYVVWVR
jgi:ankyrin repeat protein